jgi:polysaccharide biosynthesis protein PslH
VKFRVLLLSPFVPVRDGRHGGGRAIHGLATALAARHELILLHPRRDEECDPDLAARCLAVETIAVPSRGAWGRRRAAMGSLARGRSVWAGDLAVGEWQRTVAELVDRYQPDVVQVEHGVLGAALSGAGNRAARVLTIHDPAASLGEMISLQHGGARLLHRADAVFSVHYERVVLALTDAAVVFTERDRSVVARSLRSSTELVHIPLGWDVPESALDPLGGLPPTLVFVGNFHHPPNAEAARRLVQQILPLVRERRADVEVDIVGASPPTEVRALESAGVRVSGDVEDVTPFLDHAAVVVLPITAGGGTRVKLLEALGAGKASVVTGRAAAGLGDARCDAVVVADDVVDMAMAIVELLSDDEARRLLAARARTWARAELSWPVMADRYADLYRRLIAEQRR